MHLHLFGESIRPAPHKLNEPFEHPQGSAYPILTDSLAEGSEYVEDELRMMQQAFSQDQVSAAWATAVFYGGSWLFGCSAE